jgi:hypothetical protein
MCVSIFRPIGVQKSVGLSEMFLNFFSDIVREILETRAEIYRVMGEEDAKELGLDSEEEEIPKRLEEERETEVEGEKVEDDSEQSK